MKLIYKIILGILICIFIIIYWVSTITEGEYYRRHSPDGQYSIYASRDKYFNIKIPFEKLGDTGGKIHLYDELENKLVGSSSIDMISNINELFWNEEEVYSKGSMRNIKLPRKINTKTIKEYYKTIPVKYSWNLFIQGRHYKVDEVSHRRLVVSDENGKLLLQGIQHISRINNGFQVLNKNTKIEYYDIELNKLKNPPDIKLKYNEVCGNITTYGLKIEEAEKYYILKKAVGFTNYNFNNYTAIDSVKKQKVKDIYFLNKERKLEYNANSPMSEYVIINYGTYFGVLEGTSGIQYFDSVEFSESPIKIMRNGLYGYYNITPTHFLEINSFEFNLAKFKDQNNRKGYIDIYGNKYYK
ncbi:hypothetical protein [Aquimarina sp. I32.4]|uniref:hypothetical protein n=1 Tax=Aquimarina sp. I32.4 TaxID=2053903 RepID=UPI000CDEB8AA|nr:hypothetical protein [Aquimarina sp. I32.4]